MTASGVLRVVPAGDMERFVAEGDAPADFRAPTRAARPLAGLPADGDPVAWSTLYEDVYGRRGRVLTAVTLVKDRSGEIRAEVGVDWTVADALSRGVGRARGDGRRDPRPERRAAAGRGAPGRAAGRGARRPDRRRGPGGGGGLRTEDPRREPPRRRPEDRGAALALREDLVARAAARARPGPGPGHLRRRAAEEEPAPSRLPRPDRRPRGARRGGHAADRGADPESRALRRRDHGRRNAARPRGGRGAARRGRAPRGRHAEPRDADPEADRLDGEHPPAGADGLGHDEPGGDLRAPFAPRRGGSRRDEMLALPLGARDPLARPHAPGLRHSGRGAAGPAALPGGPVARRSLLPDGRDVPRQRHPRGPAGLALPRGDARREAERRLRPPEDRDRRSRRPRGRRQAGRLRRRGPRGARRAAPTRRRSSSGTPGSTTSSSGATSGSATRSGTGTTSSRTSTTSSGRRSPPFSAGARSCPRTAPTSRR